MKPPATPPNFREEFLRLMSDAAKRDPNELQKLSKLAMQAKPADGAGRYLHWEEFRFRPVPAGVEVAEWWSLTRRAREARRIDLPFKDKHGVPFFFVPTDAIARALHEIDSQTRGGVQLSGSPPNEREAKSFLVTSLVEEPFSSSVLEGAVATRDQAKKIIREGRRPKTEGERMILNNYHAIEFIKRKKDQPLTPAIILELQRLVTLGTLERPHKGGVFRGPEDDIVVEDSGTLEVLHRPPPAEDLGRRSEILCHFANTDDTEGAFIHPVLRAIVLHFMLAYDHPFVDGNGRSARALFYWSVLRRGYWLLEFVSISKVIKAAPVKYGMAFLETETDEGDLTYFIHHQLDVIRKGIDDLYAFINQKQSEISALEQALSNKQITSMFNHRQLALLNRAARAPGSSFTIDQHLRTAGVSYLTARSDLEALTKAGFFGKRKRGATSVYSPMKGLEAKLKGAPG